MQQEAEPSAAAQSDDLGPRARERRKEFPPNAANLTPKLTSRLSHMILDVRDLDRSLEFYHGILDLPIKRRDDWEGNRLAYLETGGTDILLVQQPPEDQNPLLDRSGGLVINFRVTNLPQVAFFMEQVRVPVLRGLEMAVWGERTILVADPDGYAVLLSEPVTTAH